MSLGIFLGDREEKMIEVSAAIIVERRPLRGASSRDHQKRVGSMRGEKEMVGDIAGPRGSGKSPTLRS